MPSGVRMIYGSRDSLLMLHGHADGRLRLRHASLNVLLIAVLTVLAAAIYGTYSLYRYYQFNSGTYDLVIFDQAIRSYAHFQPGISIVKGLHNGFGPHFSVLGDHFSPILAALAPLYWFYNGPQDLLIAQAVLFALAIPPVWAFTRRALGGGTCGTAGAYLVSVAYALSWPVAAAADFDFHEAAFAPVLTAVALERLQAGRIRTALLALGLLLLVKEDMGLLVAGLGLVLLVARPHLNRQRLLGLALVAGGLAAAIVSLYLIIPAMGGRSDYYFAYGAFGSNVPQALLHMLEHPGRAATELVSPRMKLDTMIWLVGAFGFLPLLSPLTLAVVPLLLERMLSSSSSHWWGVQFHYNAFIVVVLVLAAVDGGARLGRRAVQLRAYLASRPAARPAASRAAIPAAAGIASAGSGWPGQLALAVTRPPAGRSAGRAGPAGSAGAVVTPSRWQALPGNVGLAAAGLVCAMAVMFVPRSALGAMFQPGFFDLSTPQIRAEQAAVAAVPPGVMVATANKIGPHLVARDTVILWDGDGGTPPLLAPWVIATTSKVQFTFSTIAQEQTGRDGVAFLERHGYRVVFDRLGYYVLHRGDFPARHGKS
jgi:uncharacterized membrane protein